MTDDIWKIFVKRLEKIITTTVLSISTLKRKVDNISLKLKKYDDRKIDLIELLEFGEKNIVSTIEIIGQLYLNKDKYDEKKSFNQNLLIMLNIDNDTIIKKQEDEVKFIQFLEEKDKENKLSEYIWKGIDIFNKMYENEKILNK